MNRMKNYGSVCLILCVSVIFGAMGLSQIVTAVSTVGAGFDSEAYVVIDAGHGGEDGGAVSLTGVRESVVNLAIALRLNDFLHLFGVKTVMIRTEDVSVYTEGDTIAQRKVSDIRNRVRIVENTPNAFLISLHQNQFEQAQYRGAQVFYADNDESRAFAEYLQQQLSTHLDPDNHRACKPAENIYLIEHVSCPAVLLECGFLSNPTEEALLRTDAYQKRLAATVALAIFSHLEEADEI